MRSQAALILLLATAACGGRDATAPSDQRPAFAEGGGSCTVRLTPVGTIPKFISHNSSGTARFSAKNVNCNSGSSWLFTVARSGSIATVGSPSPGSAQLFLGQSVTIDVPITTGAAGTGRVIMTGDVDAPPAFLIDTLIVSVQ